MRKVWVRLGASLSVTEEEEKIIFSKDYEAASEVLAAIVARGDYEPDGDSYMPEGVAEDFNKRYGTKYGYNRDVEFDVTQASISTARYKNLLIGALYELKQVVNDFDDVCDTIGLTQDEREYFDI